MDLWRILVLAILKQGLNCDYDRLAELANEHATLRQMLGDGLMEHHYERQTIVQPGAHVEAVAKVAGPGGAVS